jgi:hypothetical protein
VILTPNRQLRWILMSVTDDYYWLVLLIMSIDGYYSPHFRLGLLDFSNVSHLPLLLVSRSAIGGGREPWDPQSTRWHPNEKKHIFDIQTKKHISHTQTKKNMEIILRILLRNCWEILEKLLRNCWEMVDKLLRNCWEMIEKLFRNCCEIV